MSNAMTLSSTLPSVTMPKAVAVVHAVVEGKTVHQACQDNFISVASFRMMLKKEPMLQAMLDEAIVIRNDVLADMLVNIDLHHSDPKMASVVSKNIQWLLERRDGERFGQRITVEGNNETSRLLAEALNMAVRRVTERPPETIVTVTDVTYEAVQEKGPAPLETPALLTAPRLDDAERRRLGLL